MCCRWLARNSSASANLPSLPHYNIKGFSNHFTKSNAKLLMKGIHPIDGETSVQTFKLTAFTKAAKSRN